MPDWIRDFLSRSVASGDLDGWAAAHPELQGRSQIEDLHRAVLAIIHVDRPAALPLGEAALALAKASSNPESLALAWRISGNALYANDDYARAVESYTNALTLFQAFGNDRETGRTLSSALQSLGYLGQYEQALEWAAKARRIFEKLSDDLRLARLNSNTGNLLYRQDRHGEAVELYERALTAFRRVGTPSDVAAVLSNIAVCRTSLGDFTAALEAHEAARKHCEAHGLSLLVAEADYNIAWLFYLRGDYVRAMDLYARTREHCVAASDQYRLALCDLDEAEMYLELNLVAEGMELARRAAEQFGRLGMGYEQAKALVSQALAEAHLVGTAASAALFRRSRGLFLKQGNRIWPALIDLYESMLARRRGNSRAALRLCRRAGRVLAGSPLPGKSALCELLESQLLLDRGELVRSRELSLAALGRQQLSETRAQRVEAYSLLARIEEEAGSEHAAFEFWERARQEIEALRSRLWGESVRISFLKDKLAVYEALAWLYLRRKDFENAFHAIEQAKSRSLAEMLAAPELLPADPETSALLGDLNADYRQLELLGLAANGAPETRTIELRERVRRREEEIGRRVTGSRSWALSASREPKDPGWTPDSADLRRSIPPGTLLIEYTEIRGILHACLIDRDSMEIVAVTETAGIRTTLRYLQLQVARIRAGGPGAVRFALASEMASLQHLFELNEALIGPIRQVIGRYSSLVVMPCGILHEVPFHALFDGERHLIDTHAVSCAPSARVFSLCMSRPPSNCTESLVMGVPDSKAPSIEAEARAVAAALGSSLFLGDAATVGVLREQGPRSRFVHVATHGIFRRDNPLFSAIRLGDSRLSVLDLYRLSLNADLVTLSGCSTGLNAVIGGDELMGLIRGVLYSGARSVLASLWDVHDQSTTDFMQGFYAAAVAGSPFPEAVRSAMIAVRRTWPHPYHWAPFMLVGASS